MSAEWCRPDPIARGTIRRHLPPAVYWLDTPAGACLAMGGERGQLLSFLCGVFIVALPVLAVTLVEGDNLLDERIAVAIGADGLFLLG